MACPPRSATLALSCSRCAAPTRPTTEEVDSSYPATTKRRSASYLLVGVTAVILDALSFHALGRADPAARRQRELAWTLRANPHGDLPLRR